MYNIMAMRILAGNRILAVIWFFADDWDMVCEAYQKQFGQIDIDFTTWEDVDNTIQTVSPDGYQIILSIEKTCFTPSDAIRWIASREGEEKFLDRQKPVVTEINTFWRI